MNITNIDISNGYIYFHANSVPYTLENMSNAAFFAKVENYSLYNSRKIDSSELEHLTINDYIEYIEEYIQYNKHDWNKIESTDTDCYLESIDKGFFHSEFCEVYMDVLSSSYFYFLKVNNEKILISFIGDKFYINSCSDSYKFTIENTDILDFETSNQIFQTMYRESESYLSVVAKEILIRSHQDYLLSKKQIVVTV